MRCASFASSETRNSIVDPKLVSDWGFASPAKVIAEMIVTALGWEVTRFSGGLQTSHPLSLKIKASVSFAPYQDP